MLAAFSRYAICSYNDCVKLTSFYFSHEYDDWRNIAITLIEGLRR